MKVSLRWLARHVDLSGIEPARLAEDLTLSTAEVEGLERWAPHLSDVRVGHVVERVPHPDADKLGLCTVDVGGPETLRIVCGAPNVAGGQRVAVATLGTALPGDVRIKKAKIRGVESCGMICSERELGLGDEHDGIWVLPADAPVGTPVAEALGLVDWVLEIDNKSLTHRPDCWGHRGLARELAAIYQRALLPLDLTLPATGSGAPFPVRVESEACPRYLALPIDGVRDGRSPEWMRHLLFAVGQRSLGLLVDVSNFVMLDLGQPNHLFDRGRLSPEGIVVRMARAGERMRTLDGVERVLVSEDLLICSGDEPVALAGVMGGEGSKVGPATSELLLEVATFHPTTIRRTAARLAARTDASARFEKSLDPTLPARAAAHLVRTLAACAPGLRLPAPPSEAGAWSDPARTLRLRPARVRALLGVEASDAEIASVLRRLEFDVRPAEASGGEPAFAVGVPSFRATKDVTIEEDLIEEFGRMHRYARVPERPLLAEVLPPPRDERRRLVRRLQERLAGAARFHEALTYSFLPDALARALGLAELPHVELVNPVAEGEQRVRRDVLPSLLGAVAKNRRQREDVRLFEIGKGYRPERADERGQPAEVHQLALVWAGAPPAADAPWDASRLLALRGLLDDLLWALGLGRARWRKPLGAGPEGAGEPLEPWLHPGRALEAVLDAADGRRELVVARAGELEPGLARPLELTGELASEVALATVSLDRLLEARVAGSGYRPLARFPGQKVDVALALPEEVEAGTVIEAIESAGKGLVASCELFDLYRGASVGAGRKSLALHVVLVSDQRTLAEADTQKFLERVERAAERLGGELRRA